MTERHATGPTNQEHPSTAQTADNVRQHAAYKGRTYAMHPLLAQQEGKKFPVRCVTPARYTLPRVTAVRDVLGPQTRGLNAMDPVEQTLVSKRAAHRRWGNDDEVARVELALKAFRAHRARQLAEQLEAEVRDALVAAAGGVS